MSRVSNRTALAVALVALGGLLVTACGGGGRSGNVVAQVGDAAITRATVSHWMATMAGGDYYEVSRKHVVPDGLVSDPPNYGRCVTRLEAAAARSSGGGPKPTSVQLLGKCQQLYQALKTQAVAYLVNGEFQIAADRELGITANQREVMQFFYKDVKPTTFPSDAEMHEYLTARRLSLSDVLFATRLNLLGAKLQPAYASAGGRTPPQLAAAWAKWTRRTSCHDGYVVEHCKQYKGGSMYRSLPPSVLMEQVAALATGRCTDLSACGKR